MKTATHQHSNPVIVPIAAAALLTALTLATPSRAATMNPAPSGAAGTLQPNVTLPQAPSTQAPAATSQAPKGATGTKGARGDRVEARIAELHSKLKITPAQETQWKAVAGVMRENAQRMEDLTKARSEDLKTMTAVDDLKSYSEIIAAHEEGLQKFISAFDSLYASMSDAQKKTADALFRQRARSHMASQHPASKSSS